MTAKPGRKPLDPADKKVNVTICMTPAELATVEAIGDGNRQEGFRKLLRKWLGKKGKTQ